MRGGELKAKLAELQQRHRARPFTREPIALLAPTSGPQLVTGICASADIDSDRCSFARGALSWPDLATLPLVLGHDVSKVVGRVLSLDYRDDGKLHIRAEVEDEMACRMPAFSICATVHEAEIIDPHSPSAFRAVVKAAAVTHIGVTDRPANAAALVTSRRGLASCDKTLDDIRAAVARARNIIEHSLLGALSTSPPSPPPVLILKAGPAHIYGKIPRRPASPAKRRPTQFAALAAALNERMEA